MAGFAYTMEGDGSAPIAFSHFEGIAARLDAELVGWFTTVAPSGGPQSSAVWFLRDGDTLVVYSASTATRLANLAANSRVAFNLRGDPRGDDIVTLEGTARVDPAVPPAAAHPAYLDKYAGEIARLGWTPESFGRDFPTAVRIVPHRLRAWAPVS